jgi:hypothetical protein
MICPVPICKIPFVNYKLVNRAATSPDNRIAIPARQPPLFIKCLYKLRSNLDETTIYLYKLPASPYLREVLAIRDRY